MKKTQQTSNITNKIKVYENKSGFYCVHVPGHVEVETFLWFEKKMVELSVAKNSNHLVLVLDMSQFTKLSFEARARAFSSTLLKEVRLDIVAYGLDSTKRASVQFLFNNQGLLNLYEESNALRAEKKAFELVNQLKMNEVASGVPALSGVIKESVFIGDSQYLLIHDKKWTYRDPRETYFYEIDLIDSNIFVSRPAGFIEYEHSINANVLFDKVTYEVLGHSNPYYRIQDYTNVEKTTYSARRDFTNYIIKNINRIEMMVFFGLNPYMKVIVNIGKLLHLGFSKVKIADTFEEALAIILEHKYGKQFAVDLESEKVQIKSDDAKNQQQLEKGHQQELQKIFEYIGKMLWSEDGIEYSENTNDHYKNIYQALEVLKNDVDEIVAKKDRSLAHMSNQLFKFSEEIKQYRQEIRKINLAKQEYMDTLHYEIRTPVHSILITSELIHLNKNEEDRKKYLQLLLESARDLSLKMNRQNERLHKRHSYKHLCLSVFNLDQSIKNQIGVFKSIGLLNDLKIEYRAGIIEDYFIGDLEKIGSILDHLVLNAIQNSAKGSIIIRTDLKEHLITRQKISIEVIDQGYGLSKAAQSIVGQIFRGEKPDPLYLARLRFGNGLMVSQQLAELLGGQLFYEHQEQGSLFRLILTLDLGVFSKELNLLKRPTSIRYLKSMGNSDLTVLLWKEKSDISDPDILVLKELGILPYVINNQEDLKMHISNKKADIVFFDYLNEKDLEDKSNFILGHTSFENIKLCGITTNLDVNMDEIKRKKLIHANLLKPYSVKSFVDVIKATIAE